MGKKVCSKCGRELPLSNDYFEKRKVGSKDGFRGVCRECKGGKFLNSINIDKLNVIKEYVRENSSCELMDKQFISVDTKMKFKCSCGEVFETTFYKFKYRNKRQCNKCSKQELWSNDRIEQWILDNTTCVLVKIYDRVKESRIDIKLKCLCGEVFKTNFRTFLRKKHKCCNYCSDYSYYDIEMIRKYVKDNSKCELLESEYSSVDTFIKFKCECGEEFTTSFINFRRQNKRQCDKCGYKIRSDKQQYTYLEVKEYIENNSECVLISKEYTSCYDKLELRCECGEHFWVNFDKFKNQGIRSKTRCDSCSNKISMPEMMIKDFLESNNISFKREVRFNDCKYKGTLPFDFYLDEFNICIEYDGEFHYKKTTLGNDLDLQKKRDKIKTDYCKQTGIRLIRIPYWECDNINEILIKELNINQKELA